MALYAAPALPSALHEGLLEFHLDRQDYFVVLSMLEGEERDKYPLHAALAEQSLGLPQSYSLKQLEKHLKGLEQRDRAKLRLASLLYAQGDCKNALKHLKGKSKSLNSGLQTQRAYLRGQCFIELGNHNFAAQALSSALEGEWAASAYYNLAADYAASSRNPRRALLALKVARDINQGSSLSEDELTNRINLSAGALYLDNDKPDLANDFFNQIAMSSIYVTQALYLSGLSKHALQDYRGAIQSWLANQQYGLSSPGVAESLIAIPQAQALSGFQTEALESYIKASKQFQDEQEIIDNVLGAIKEYGAVEVLLDERPKAELQWFLERSSSTNTQRAVFLTYLSQTPELYALFKEYAQLKSLEQMLSNKQVQLSSLEKTLGTQIRVIDSKQSDANIAELKRKAASLLKSVDALESQISGTDLARTRSLVTDLEKKLGSVSKQAQDRKLAVKQQLKDISKAKARIASAQKRLTDFYARLDQTVSRLSQAKLLELRQSLASYYEQAELGLVQILEAQARLRTKRTNLLDARYQ